MLRYPSDIHFTRGCRKGIAGSRVILQIMLERNMVEVECPSCTKTVDLGSDSTGTYECPYCHEDFEYESSIKKNLILKNKNRQSPYGVKKVTKPFAGYYRLGLLRDYDEKQEGNYSQTEEETSFFGNLFAGILKYVLLPILFILLIPSILSSIVMKLIQIWTYKLGGHPGKMLTEVEHLYIHPDGRVIVPLNDLAPFRFNIEKKMRIETHFHNGKWRSVSILKGRKCYFSLGPLPRIDGQGMWPTSDREEIYQFLRRFDLKECEKHTASSNGGDGGGGGS